MRSIKTRLISIFTSLILVLLLGIGVISTGIISKSLVNKAHKDLEVMAVAEAKYINSICDAETSYISATSQSPILLDEKLTLDEKVDYFIKEAKRTGYIEFALADKSGNVISFNKEKSVLNIKDRDYYKKAISGKLATSDVIISKTDGKPVIMFAAPVIRDGKIKGVFYGLKEGTFLSNIASGFKYEETGYAYVINNNGTSVGDKNRDLVLKQYNFIEATKENSDMKSLVDVMQNKMVKREVGSGKYFYEGKNRMVGFAPIEGSQWIMVIGMETQEVLKNAHELRNILIIFSLIAIAIGIVITYIVSGRIVKPIILLTGHIEKMANYDLTFVKNDKSKYLNRKDEIGKIGRAILTMQDNFSSLIKDVEEATEQVSSSSEEFTANSEQSATTSEEVANTIEEIASGASNQAQASEKGAHSMEELGRCLEENQKQLKELNIFADEVINNKDEGIITVEHLVQTSNENSEIAKEIVDVIASSNESAKDIQTASEMIQSIAEQTNLLALNAAIESARAGEAGKGFAVVADEIRKLAEEANKFAVEIKDIVTILTQKTENAVLSMDKAKEIVNKQNELVKETEGEFSGIANAVEKAKKAIENLNVSSEEMENKKNEMLEIIQNLSAIAEENAAGTQEASASVEEQAASVQEIANSGQHLAELAEDLNKLIMKFTIDTI